MGQPNCFILCTFGQDLDKIRDPNWLAFFWPEWEVSKKWSGDFCTFMGCRNIFPGRLKGWTMLGCSSYCVHNGGWSGGFGFVCHLLQDRTRASDELCQEHSWCACQFFCTVYGWCVYYFSIFTTEWGNIKPFFKILERIFLWATIPSLPASILQVGQGQWRWQPIPDLPGHPQLFKWKNGSGSSESFSVTMAQQNFIFRYPDGSPFAGSKRGYGFNASLKEMVMAEVFGNLYNVTAFHAEIIALYVPIN